MKYIENIIAGATLPLYNEFGQYTQLGILDFKCDVITLCDKYKCMRLNYASEDDGRKSKILLETLPVLAFVLCDRLITVDVLLSTGVVVLNLRKKDLNWGYLQKYVNRFGIFDEKGYIPDEVRNMLHTSKSDMEVVDIYRAFKLGVKCGSMFAIVTTDRYNMARKYSDLRQKVTVSDDSFVIGGNGVKYKLIEYHSHSRVFVQDENGYIRSMSVDMYKRLSGVNKDFSTMKGSELRVNGVRFLLERKSRNSDKCCVLTSDGYIFIDIPISKFTPKLAEDKCYRLWKSHMKDTLTYNISEIDY